MGDYFNPGNEAFWNILHNRFYEDKTGLLRYTNSLIGSANHCIAVSHARRFGKTQVARMLKAYYSRGCDSRELFSKFTIADSQEDFIKHLNKYNVIYIDMMYFLESYKENFIDDMTREICEEIMEEYDSINYNHTFAKILSNVKNKSGIKFVIIIDEWDCVIRQYPNNNELVHKYLQFLHSIFKSELAENFLALAYMTGIMPIKKIKDESALNNFKEFTMLRSLHLTEYFGFTEDEVKKLCERNNVDFQTIKDWYDGYIINGKHIYNPNSVYEAIENKYIDSYWRETSSFESINDYITKGYMGLKDAIWMMIAGEKVRVNTGSFKNDLSLIETRDEALTALIHLGYLGYDSKEHMAFIPNFEILNSFDAALQKTDWEEAKILARSSELLNATLQGDARTVESILKLAHDTYTDIISYNNELALKCTVMMAYFSAWNYYTLVSEYASGKGYADIAFLPRRDVLDKPAMVIELKDNDSVDTAIKQIKERRYTGRLVGHAESVLLVGITYDPKEKEHHCIIERASL